MHYLPWTDLSFWTDQIFFSPMLWCCLGEGRDRWTNPCNSPPSSLISLGKEKAGYQTSSLDHSLYWHHSLPSASWQDTVHFRVHYAWWMHAQRGILCAPRTTALGEVNKITSPKEKSGEYSRPLSTNLNYHIFIYHQLVFGFLWLGFGRGDRVSRHVDRSGDNPQRCLQLLPQHGGLPGERDLNAKLTRLLEGCC